MTIVLVRKLLADIRNGLILVMIFLFAFQCLWAKVTERITEEILPALTRHLPLDRLLDILFAGPGQMIQTLMGGELINLLRARDVLSIGYVHPLMQTVLCVWAIGRAAGAIAGEIDRGTMELLLAQPVARSRLIAAHFVVDTITIPLLLVSIWAGNWVGISVFGHLDWNSVSTSSELRLNPLFLAPGLANVAALLFAVSGYTIWLSAAGSFRWRVLGMAVLVTLAQFLINLIGQLWGAAAALRPLSVFYYFQPQQIILANHWTVSLDGPWHLAGPWAINVIAVLLAVGVLGYGMALWTFSRRDLPAPL
jgi:ABC-2 type transport system permease protein